MKLALPESNVCILFTLADFALRRDLLSDNREGRAEEWRRDEDRAKRGVEGGDSGRT